MKIKNFLKISLSLAILGAGQISCIHDDKWDAPEIVCNNKFDAPTMTMAEFVALSPATGVYSVPAQDATHPAVIFDGYVVSSDANGNFYKTLVFQDKPQNPTVGLVVGINKSLNYADFPVGAHIRIKANGMVIGKSNDVITLGVTDPDFAIGRIPESIISRFIAGVCNGNGLDIATIVPQELTLAQIKQDARYVNTLAIIKNIQFVKGEIGLPLINKDLSGAYVDTNRNLVDGAGNTAVLRTDGFFKPTSYVIPDKSGDITFIVSKFGVGAASYQNIIRGVSDINFTKPRFAEGILGGTALAYSGAFTENFESYALDNALFPKYLNYSYIGNRYWQVKSFSGNKYIQMSANGGTANTTYTNYFLVPVDFTTANNLSYRVNVGFYNGNALKVYTTTNYIPGTEITTATLNEITSNFTTPVTPTTGYGTLTTAGTYNLPANLTGNGFIVFKYEGNSSGITTTVQLDDIKVQ
ncbi:hypothetical protein QFZ37_000332 [Chryseobacterium ginsenosidimutans]|uniref:DUF5689 domain-containing protein n=1 Tax=Chryseobacterium ginsenosidimutans TaxID=687846 RepID=UPI00277FDB7F|nr:DUF5689 domain-containing protein [Chryseobacterium ginsenosidimutans]MDQ0591963.1 hypothetical protein [Chryseobacterium ginsenosidimutans]